MTDDGSDQAPVSLPLDHTENSERQADSDAYASAAFYGPAVPPIGMSFARAAAIEAQ